MKARTWIAPLVAGALVAAACSGDGDNAGGTTTSDSPSTTHEATTTTKRTTTTTTTPPKATSTTAPTKRLKHPCRAGSSGKQASGTQRPGAAKRRRAAADDGRRRRASAERRSSATEQRPTEKRKANTDQRPKSQGWAGGHDVSRTTAPPKRDGEQRRANAKDGRRATAKQPSKRGDRQRSKASRAERRQQARQDDGGPCKKQKPKANPKPKKQAKPPPPRRMPLSGRILGKNEPLPQRPALVVKIDNHPAARPQSGLNSADIVFEEIVEWGTRFAAVFHSERADPLGPIRSGRTQDINMLGRLNRPLFAWSGGNANVEAAIAGSNLVDLNAAFAGGYYRGSGSAPHNLYNSTDALWSQTPPGWKQPGQYFDYLERGESFGGPQAAGVELNLDSFHVWWGWNPDQEAYFRATSGTPHYDAAEGQVRARNIVIVETAYHPSVADARSPEAQTIGSGRVWVFSDGHMRRGTWTRGGPTSPYLLKTADGKNVIELRSGRTYVELAEVSVDGEPRPLPVPNG